MRRATILLFAIACAAGLIAGPTLAVTYEPGPGIVARAVGSADGILWSNTISVAVGGTALFADDYSFDADTVNDPWTVYDTLNSWAWDFGDGGLGSGQNTSHVYSTAGTYSVTLTADDQPLYADDSAGTSNAVVVSVVNAVLSLTLSPNSIPRDTISESTATATVTSGGSPAVGRAVSFAIISGPGVVTVVNGTTDSSGHATAKVRSTDIAEGATGDAEITVRARCLGVSEDATLWVRGLVMTLASDYPKVYIGNASWRKNTALTCTVKDTQQVAAKGTVAFSTERGTLSPASQTLTPSGVATTTLTPSDAAYTNTAFATLGPITKSAQVKFADHGSLKLEFSPHKKTTEQAYAKASLQDNEGEPFPGTTISIGWQVPRGIISTSSLPTPTGYPPPPFTVDSLGPTPTADDYGTIQAFTSRITSPQCIAKYTQPSRWTLEYLEGEGLTIKNDWEGNGTKFKISTDSLLRYIISATKDF